MKNRERGRRERLTSWNSELQALLGSQGRKVSQSHEGVGHPSTEPREKEKRREKEGREGDGCREKEGSRKSEREVQFGPHVKRLVLSFSFLSPKPNTHPAREDLSSYTPFTPPFTLPPLLPLQSHPPKCPPTANSLTTSSPLQLWTKVERSSTEVSSVSILSFS